MSRDKNEKHPEEESQEIKVPQSPSEITEENAHLVDFENLKVRLICLVANPSQFKNTANFLERRGWTVFVTHQIKDALTQVGTFKPDFVLVSVNHPHRKIQQFPQILMQTFQVTTIAFGEQTDPKTMGAIQAARTSFKINGHLSGPMAQRKIKQILQDLYGQSDSSTPDSLGEASNVEKQSDSIRISGPGDSSSNFGAQNSQGGRSGMMIFEKSKDDKGLSDYNPFTSGGGGQGDSKPGASGLAYDPTRSQGGAQQKSSEKTSYAEKIQRDKEKMAEALKELGSDLEKGNLDYGETSSRRKPDESYKKSSAKGAPVFTQLELGPEKKERSQGDISETKSSGAGQFSLKQGNSATGSSFQIQPEQSGSSYQTKSAASGGASDIGYSKGHQQDRQRLKDEGSRSFIEQATIDVVSKMQSEKHEDSPKMGEVRRMGLLSICHSRHKGYFMIADHEIGMSLDDFVQEFTENLKAYCKDHGETIDISEYINMDCPSYDFFENSEDGLEFNLVTSFGPGEIGIKFINDEEAWADATTTDNHEKALINPKQVVEDQPLEMDLFVHLTRNKKYYKIVGKDSELSKERKDRLVEKKTDVFINQEDVGAYRKYQTKQKALKAINQSKDKAKKKAS